MQAKTRISLFILLILGLHAIPVLWYQGERQTRWPFLAWAMYARSFPPGPIDMTTRRLVATFASGKEEQVTGPLVGLPSPAFQKAYVTPVWRGDSAPAYELIQRLNRRGTDPIVQIRFEGESQTLVDTGVVTTALPVLIFHAQPARAR
jgi:hypothetical protein